MELLPKTITKPAGRIGAVAQNALEVARFGGLATDEQPSPFEVAGEHRVYKLRHYYPRPNGDSSPGALVLLVPPMMLAAEIYDVAPPTSAVTLLHHHGADPWLVDFGSPEREEGGLERTLADHVLAVSDAVDGVRELTGRDAHLAGYSQGGMFCYQAAAYRRNQVLSSLITFGSPVGSSSCCSCTTGRRCCPVSASAASWRPTAGSRGRDRRWRTSCASSSPTTGCSRAAS